MRRVAMGGSPGVEAMLRWLSDENGNNWTFAIDKNAAIGKLNSE